MTESAAPAFATIIVLMSALMHAGANLLTKMSDDALITRGCMNGIAMLVGIPMLAVVEPPTPQVWSILMASVLVHGLYPFFLAEAYRRSDLSAAFPLARGSSPIFVAALSLALPTDTPHVTHYAGITLICVAVASFAFERPPNAAFSFASRIGIALATGLVVAIYTLIDAAGVRTAANPFTYIVWLLVLDGAFVLSAVGFARRGALPRYVQLHWRSLAAAGILGVLAYASALYALRIGNVAQVAALRESSVLFSALLGALYLREPFGRRRVVAATGIVLGIALMHLA